MRELLLKLVDTRWGSTKFWLVVGTFSVFTWLLTRGALSQDNYFLLAGGVVGAYLGVNLLQHRTYTGAETARAESAAITKRALNASDAVTEQQENRIQGNGVSK